MTQKQNDQDGTLLTSRKVKAIFAAKADFTLCLDCLEAGLGLP